MKDARLILGIILVSLTACHQVLVIREEPAQEPERIQRFRSNAIYHWKTAFDLDDEELDFLDRHSVHRMYVRYFDVDLESSPITGSSSVVPVGTTVFKSPIPEGIETVPTVFITVRALRTTGSEGIEDLASKIYTRVRNMTDYNGLGPLKEIQLDCDWTASTKEAFYALCKKVSGLAHKDSVLVSSTIRLHQLRTAPPPVDLGVLMVYNTGALRDKWTTNSILDYEDVKSYLSGKPVEYGLPLDFAFPAYGWGVVFREGSYTGILHHTDFEDGSLYGHNDEGMVTVKKDHWLDGSLLLKGDEIRMEYPDAGEVLKVAGLIASKIESPSHNVILYHLDSQNLQKYSDDEISSIYSH